MERGAGLRLPPSREKKREQGKSQTYNPKAVEVRLELTLAPRLKGLVLGALARLGDVVSRRVVALPSRRGGGRVRGAGGTNHVVAGGGGLVSHGLSSGVAVLEDEVPGYVSLKLGRGVVGVGGVLGEERGETWEGVGKQIGGRDSLQVGERPVVKGPAAGRDVRVLPHKSPQLIDL